MIPAEVRHDHRLSPLERLVYGDILSLSKLTGGVCKVTNAALAKEHGRKSTQISGAITNLAKCGHIRTELKGRGKNNREIIPLTGIKGIPENR